MFVANLLAQWVPRSIPAGATLGTLVIAAWAREMWRSLQEHDESGGAREGARTLVIGAGEAGRELISSMLRDPQRRYQPRRVRSFIEFMKSWLRSEVDWSMAPVKAA